jgi:hypothetical protein
MKALIVIAVLLFVPGGAMAARWEKATVPVWDFTPDDWRPYVQATVDDFNANLPPSVPHLVYTPMGELPCESLPGKGKPGGITVCTSPAERSNTARTTVVHRRITRSRIALTPPIAWGRALASELRRVSCHEFGHGVLYMPDDHTYPHAEESCVQGTLDHLGPWDIAYAADAYRHHSGPRHRSGGQHHRAKRGRA